jgi:hypothetical protein
MQRDSFRQLTRAPGGGETPEALRLEWVTRSLARRGATHPCRYPGRAAPTGWDAPSRCVRGGETIRSVRDTGCTSTPAPRPAIRGPKRAIVVPGRRMRGPAHRLPLSEKAGSVRDEVEARISR